MIEISSIDQIDNENIVLIYFGSDTSSSNKFNEITKTVFDVGDFKGNLNEIFFAYNYKVDSSTKRIILLGLGKTDNLTVELIRRVFGALGSKLRDKNIESLGIDFSPMKDLSDIHIESAIEGILLGNYRYDTMKTNEKNFKKSLKVLSIKSPSDLSSVMAYAKATSTGTNLARELGNLPSNIATPTYLAEKAKDLESLGIKVTILEKDEIIKERMGMFSAVFQGSADIDPPKFIIMEYEPETYDKTLILVGKAITFDTGGVSLKPVAGMKDMISDMCGGGAVIGAMNAIGTIKPNNLRIIGLVPSTPNVVDGKSYRPGDVITSRAGKTIEVFSTDAEGRMLLADALDYAKQYNPDLVLNFATLTGSIERALGKHYAGYFTNEKANNENLKEKIFNAGQLSGDKLWQMPLDEDYMQQLKSNFADLRQTGGAFGGSITAALLLNQFTNYPWVHFDIAGTAFLNSPHKPINYNSQVGATGFGVRFINQFIRDWA